MKREDNFKSYSKDEFKKLFDKISHGRFILMSEYINSKNDIIVKHVKCNNVFNIKPNLFLFKFKKNPNHDTCIHCCGLNKRTTEEFKNDVYDMYKDEYIILSEYKNVHTKVRVHHNIETCKGGKNNVFEIEPNSLLHGHRCPYCKSSNGEEKIGNFLKEHDIKYNTHVRNLGCKSNKNYPLEFDYQIFVNDSTFILLEYDGRLHYEPWNSNKKNEEKLYKQQENDNIKNEFCKKNNYKLIRISYKDDLIQKLNELLITLNDYRKYKYESIE